VDLPFRRQNGVDVRVGEEVRRAVRAIEHAQRPFLRQIGQRRGGRASPVAAPAGCSVSPASSRRAAWPPNWPSSNVLRLSR
jgi:hypothetical protein